MNSDPSPIDSSVPPTNHEGGSSPQTQTTSAFLGPNGIRAGWRILIMVALFLGFLSVLQVALSRIPPIHAWMHAKAASGLGPAIVLVTEGMLALCLLLSVLVMRRIEQRSFADYYLPGKEAFGKRFWQGLPYGFAMLTLLMGFIAALRGFSLGNLALSGPEAVRYAFLYLLAFLLVAFFEEFAFRGYLQATLGSGIGFWPAAIVLALVFGGIHLGNTGEAVFGALMAGCFGLLAAFSLSRTGAIWFAIGMHAAWDWGETYFYSVPDSGNVASGHLLNSSLHGPNWLTGGTVGPEGSMFAPLVLGVSAVLIHYMFPLRSRSDS